MNDENYNLDIIVLKNNINIYKLLLEICKDSKYYSYGEPTSSPLSLSCRHVAPLPFCLSDACVRRSDGPEASHHGTKMMMSPLTYVASSLAAKDTIGLLVPR